MTHQVVEQETVSTGIHTRVKVSLVVDPGADLAAVICEAAQQAQQDKWDVAFIFVYADRREVGTALPLARGRWTRNGAKGIPAIPWSGALDTITERRRKGTLQIAIEREV